MVRFRFGNKYLFCLLYFFLNEFHTNSSHFQLSYYTSLKQIDKWIIKKQQKKVYEINLKNCFKLGGTYFEGSHSVLVFLFFLAFWIIRVFNGVAIVWQYKLLFISLSLLIKLTGLPKTIVLSLIFSTF